jgi:hypothetical protein
MRTPSHAPPLRPSIARNNARAAEGGKKKRVEVRPGRSFSFLSYLATGLDGTRTCATAGT